MTDKTKLLKKLRTITRRNTTIPTRRSQLFSMEHDGNAVLEIMVYQGTQRTTAENLLLGRIRLDGCPNEREVARPIEVTLEVEVDHAVTLHARDVETGRETSSCIAVQGDRPAPAAFFKAPIA